MPAVLDDISAEILDLKKKIGATILAHYYQEGEIQELADFTGDSLKLARAATKVDRRASSSAASTSWPRRPRCSTPTKRVLLPDLQAGCSLAGRCPADKLARYQEMLREQRPQVPDRHLHQQHGRGEGALRLGRHLAATPRRSSAACRRITRSSSCPTGTWASTCRK